MCQYCFIAQNIKWAHYNSNNKELYCCSAQCMEQFKRQQQLIQQQVRKYQQIANERTKK